MTTVAVIGAASALGRAVLEQLDEVADVRRVLGVDVAEPPMPVAKLELRAGDARDPRLAAHLQGAEVVVHLGAPELTPEAAAGAGLHEVLVDGVANVLAACERVGAGVLVHVSSGAVYGAQPDNPIPLAESAPLRAGPEFSYAHCHRLAEERVAGWARDHPSVRTVVLRPAVTLGPGVDDFVTRHLLAPALPLVRGYDPPFQAVHVDDVAAAVVLAATGSLAGAYNVAADGWVELADLCAILGRPAVYLPEQIAFSAAAWLHRRGWLAVPAGALPYVMHPWVLSAARLHDAGWAPEHSNRETLRRFAADHAGQVTLGRHTLQLGRLLAGTAAALGLATLTGVVLRRRRRQPRSVSASSGSRLAAAHCP